MFGEDISGKFLEKWMTTFKKKIIQQCIKLPSPNELEDLLLAADTPDDGTQVDDDIGWDGDLSLILLLLHLIPPLPWVVRNQGRCLLPKQRSILWSS
ncbi:hypothetical protein ILYODFUR_022448, partial [Ilyodon furcidens]